MEILGYNLVHWMAGDLPWMDNLTNGEWYERLVRKRALVKYQSQSEVITLGLVSQLSK